MKNIGFGAWRFQLYWPRVYIGRFNYGIKADTAIMVRIGEGWAAFGWELLGFGFGVSYDFAAFNPPANNG